MRGQSLPEFALLAPLVFAVIFGAINGGLFMFARNGVENGATTGMISLAAAGNDLSADQTAVTAMRKGGIAGTLTKINFISVRKETYNAATGAYADDDTGCSPSCENKYDLQGNPMWNYSSCVGDPTYHCPPWPPASRSVHASSPTFIKLTVDYNFTFLTSATSFHVTSTKIFDVEPKDL